MMSKPIVQRKIGESWAKLLIADYLWIPKFSLKNFQGKYQIFYQNYVAFGSIVKREMGGKQSCSQLLIAIRPTFLTPGSAKISL